VDGRVDPILKERSLWQSHSGESGQRKIVFETVVEALVRLVREFKSRPRGEHSDRQKSPWRS